MRVENALILIVVVAEFHSRKFENKVIRIVGLGELVGRQVGS